MKLKMPFIISISRCSSIVVSDTRNFHIRLCAYIGDNNDSIELLIMVSKTNNLYWNIETITHIYGNYKSKCNYYRNIIYIPQTNPTTTFLEKCRYKDIYELPIKAIHKLIPLEIAEFLNSEIKRINKLAIGEFKWI